jgi:hypothetical protein
MLDVRLHTWLPLYAAATPECSTLQSTHVLTMGVYIPTHAAHALE